MRCERPDAAGWSNSGGRRFIAVEEKVGKLDAEALRLRFDDALWPCREEKKSEGGKGKKKKKREMGQDRDAERARFKVVAQRLVQVT